MVVNSNTNSETRNKLDREEPPTHITYSIVTTTEGNYKATTLYNSHYLCRTQDSKSRCVKAELMSHAYYRPYAGYFIYY